MPHSAATAVPAAAKEAAPTAADADAFLARAEKELGNFAVTVNQASWVNSTYVNDDTDAVAAYVGTVYTEMQVRLASEAARYQNVPGLSADAKRKLNLLRDSLVLAAPTTPGAAA